MDDRDKLWILLCIAALSVAQILHSRAIGRLEQDVAFALIASHTGTAAEAHDD